ncbi:hypothetical protein MMC13_005324 [Lambiella insularis]|nr:hypothetical protein [Lambiella insularis]
MLSKLLSLPIALLSLLLPTTHALPSCLNPTFLSPNATGTLLLAGFQPPELGVNSTWTLSTALASASSPGNNSGLVAQTFWLTSAPFVDLSSAATPLTGCVLALAAAGNPRYSSPAADGQASCAGVLAPACQQALLDSADNASLANSGSGPATQGACEAFLAAMPEECDADAVSVLAVSDVLGNQSPLAASCPDYPSLGAGSATQAPLIDVVSAPYSPAGSVATYDTWVGRATPLLITAWLKNGTGPEVWSDTRLVCVTAGDVLVGSRVPSGAGRVEMGARRGWIVGLGLGVGVWMGGGVW